MEGIVAARTRDALSIRDVLFSMDGSRCNGDRVFLCARQRTCVYVVKVH